MIQRRILGFLLIDLLVTALVIGTAATIFISMSRHSLNIVRTAASVTEFLTCYRTDLSAYYALRGDWPKDIEDLHAMFPDTPQTNAGFANDIRISGGAADIRLQGPLAGKTVTIHPAMPLGEPLGPVKWVAGPGNSPDGWSVIGEDNTTVESRYILNLLQR